MHDVFRSSETHKVDLKIQPSLLRLLSNLQSDIPTTITDAGGKLGPVPYSIYISLWNQGKIMSPPSPTSTCVGNCITSVPGCDFRGPTTQTGIVTITDVEGKLVPVPCPMYISI